jgi:hypothetical protein
LPVRSSLKKIVDLRRQEELVEKKNLEQNTRVWAAGFDCSG